MWQVNKGEDPDRKQREREFHNREFSDTARGSADKYYAVTRRSLGSYLNLVRERCAGKRVLEYGCGPGGAAFELTLPVAVARLTAD